MREKIFLLTALLCAFVQGAWAADRNYEYPTKTKPSFYSSYGGKSNVVVINTEAELAYITANFSDGSGYNDNKKWYELDYYLNADLDMGENISWLPLGRVSYTVTKYSGTFWGNGHTISYRIWALDEENQGLFATIHKDGKVYDVNVVCNINSKRDYVGGIAGENYGLIHNCSVMATIVEEDNDYVGGIVGENTDYGKVEGCYVEGTITGLGSATKIGGIAGKSNSKVGGGGIVHEGNILNCWVSANISSDCNNFSNRPYVGGICGENKGNMQYCCMTGDVACASEGNYQVGGLAGSSSGSTQHCTFYGTVKTPSEPLSKYIGNSHANADWFDTFSQAEYDDAVSNGHALYAYAIRNVFALTVTTTGTGTVTVSDFNAETIDYDKVPTGHWIYVYITSGVVSSFIVKDADGKDVEVTRYHQYGDNYYMFPMPRSNVSVTVNFTTQQGDGSEENPYIISTAEEWKAFATDVNDNGKSFEGKFFMLGGDFTLGSYSTVGNGYSFINAFKGTLDGNGHTITISNTPPFGHVMDATIKNLNIAGDATLSSWSGCIVQHWNGTLNLINCRVSVNVNCRGDQYFGGLAGQMYIPGSGASTNPNMVIIDGCVFDGSFNSTVTNEYRAHDCSGFVGDAGEGGTVIIRNSILKPGSVGEGILSNTFAYMSSGTPTIENSYYVYVDNLPTNQGTQARTVSAGADVTLSGLGTATATYGANGITAYATGIKYNDVYYAGSGEAVTLNVSHGVNSGYTFSQYTATNGGTLANAATSTPTLTMPAADVTIGIEWTKNTASLFDNADNTTFINSHDGDVYDITLAGRTLYKDGKWNTLCLPFSVTIAGSPLAGATARPLTEASISGTTLNLTFGEAVTTLQAGTPYIIKWASGTDLTAANPVFSGVTIDADADGSYDSKTASPAVTTDERVRFLGTYKSTTFDAEDKSILLMGGDNTLYYPATGAGIGAQRAYFKIGDDGALLARRLTAFNINFGDDEATGIISLSTDSKDSKDNAAWYSLDGRKLQGKPSRAGVYINNGIKVVIK